MLLRKEAILFWLFISISLAQKYSLFDGLDKNGYNELVPEMLRKVDHLKNVDPFYFIRGGGVAHKSDSDAVKARWKEPDLDKPSLDSVPPERLEKLEEILFSDRFLKMAELTLKEEAADREPDTATMIKLAASLTPILGDISDACMEQSLGYLENIGIEDWALKMLDSTGKTPDGVLGDVSTLCEFMNDWVKPGFCDDLNDEVADLVDIIIPRGNTVAFGSFEGCLKVEAHRNNSDPLRWDHFQGQHCIVKLVGSSGTQAKAHRIRDPFHPSSYFSPDPRFAAIPWLIDELFPDGLIPESLTDLVLLLSQPSFGVCIPSACTQNDVYLNYLNLYRGVGAAGLVYSCDTQQTQDDLSEFDDVSYLAAILLSVVAFLMIVGTGIDVFQQLFRKPKGELEVYGGRKDNFVVSLFKCFSVNINGRKILNTDSNAGNSDSLDCINGIRFLSMCWVILGHTYIVSPALFTRNPKKFWDTYLGKSTVGYEILWNGIFSVDSFFFMSGLLVAYHTFLELDKKRFNIVLYYVHRIIRLTIPLAFVILFTVGIYPLLAKGPLAALQIPYLADRCRDNWWTNLLYVNNLVDAENMCLPVTWYLACDMQMYVVAPLVLLPMYWGSRKMHAGLIWWTLVFLLFTAVPIGLSAKHHLPPGGGIIYQPVDDFNYTLDFYNVPWARAQPYLIGILTGYVLWRKKEKGIRMHWAIAALLWVVALVLSSTVIFGTYVARSKSTYQEESYSNTAAAAYNGLARAVWGLILMWVTIACIKGYGGLINSILSWGFFKPLARINYLTYLLHVGVLQLVLYSATYSIEFTDIIASYYFVGFVMITYGVAFVAALMVESPFIALEKLLLGGLRKAPERDAKKPGTYSQQVFKNGSSPSSSSTGASSQKPQRREEEDEGDSGVSSAFKDGKLDFGEHSEYSKYGSTEDILDRKSDELKTSL